MSSKKCVVNENPYACSLTPALKKKALDELGEDDNIREQALEQFREWIIKHPRIKNCRTDVVFLLRFLRLKKFCLPAACNSLERYLTICEMYPVYFKNLDIEGKIFNELIESGYLLPLPQRDVHGRQLILRRTGQINPHTFSSAQLVQIYALLLESYVNDETTHISGFVCLEDFANTNIAHLAIFSLTELKMIFSTIIVSRV